MQLQLKGRQVGSGRDENPRNLPAFFSFFLKKPPKTGSYIKLSSSFTAPTRSSEHTEDRPEPSGARSPNMLSEKGARSPPCDRGQAVAIIFFILGVETLLPWNFFITASEYFNGRLNNNNNNSSSRNATMMDASKGYNYDCWMSLLSQLPLLLFTLLNSFIYQWVKEHLRMAFSMVAIFIFFLLTAALVQVDMQPDTFFSITMTTIWFINMFGAVLQSSLFGVVSQFPPRYSTLFMSGQGLAGIFAGIAMLCSIFSNPDRTSAALGYFITPCFATLVSLVCYMMLPRLEFARFYLSRNQSDKGEAAQELISSDQKVLSSEKKDLEANGKITSRGAEREQRASVFAVFKKIWVMALCVTWIFAVTLAVFPVITVRVQTVYVGSKWADVFTCVCCFIVFYIMDLLGRGAPSLKQWPSKESSLFPIVVFLRVIFIPMLMMCNIKDSKLPIFFRHDSAFVVIMALFSFTNGYLACLCMSYAPQLVRCKDCETAGSLMTFFLALGLALGAGFSFLLGGLV
ncbi:equilibrative nucleoside transporter 2 isoform X1 [Oryzias latipes]